MTVNPTFRQSLELLLKGEHGAHYVSTGIGSVFTLASEAVQIATVEGLLAYTWFTGHASDFFVVPTLMGTIALYAKDMKNTVVKKTAPLLAPIICTLHEYFPLDKGEAVFDPQDIVLYWIAATVTYASTSIASSKQLREGIRSTARRCNPLQYFGNRSFDE